MQCIFAVHVGLMMMLFCKIGIFLGSFHHDMICFFCSDPMALWVLARASSVNSVNLSSPADGSHRFGYGSAADIRRKAHSTGSNQQVARKKNTTTTSLLASTLNRRQHWFNKMAQKLAEHEPFECFPMLLVSH